jgi:hypothetical protein
MNEQTKKQRAAEREFGNYVQRYVGGTTTSIRYPVQEYNQEHGTSYTEDDALDLLLACGHCGLWALHPDDVTCCNCGQPIG